MHHGKLELQLKYAAVSRVTSTGPLVNDGQWRKVRRINIYTEYIHNYLSELFLKNVHGQSLLVMIDRKVDQPEESFNNTVYIVYIHSY